LNMVTGVLVLGPGGRETEESEKDLKELQKKRRNADQDCFAMPGKKGGGAWGQRIEPNQLSAHPDKLRAHFKKRSTRGKKPQKSRKRKNEPD